jgi:hypothetical protein
MQSRNLWLAAICLIAAGVLGYFLAAKRASDLNSNVVMTYKVPPERAEEIRQTLNRLFWKPGDQSLASVQVFNEGMLLVAAPKGYQNGIDKLVENLGALKPASPRTVIRSEYWLVLAEDGPSNSVTFRDLGKVLSALEQSDGNKHFRTLEHIRVLSSNDEEFFSKGQFGEFKGTLSLKENLIKAKISLFSNFGEMRTNMELKPNEFVVLGQNAVKEGERTGVKTSASIGSNVYHIVRTEIVP